VKTASVVLCICCCLSGVNAQQPLIGVVDTVGGTTLDDLTNGPAWRMLVNTPGHGMHAVWMYSGDTSGALLDRNIRYNFYDYVTGAWSYPDSDFMQGGVYVFVGRAGYGSIDIDTNGVAVISAHHATTGANFAPIVARDVDVGQAIFDYSPGEPTLDGYVWPCVGVGMNGYYHLAMLENATQDNLYWGRMTSWPTWDAAVSMPSPQPEPLFPDHNIATSKVPGSNKVCITWVAVPATGAAQMPGFYRESRDGGDHWDTPLDIGFPPAFHPGSETVPSYHVSSLFPLYDRNDNLHIVGNVSPFVRDTFWPNLSEIWHFCPDNTPSWTRIHRAGSYSLLAPMGNNATYACRPSIGEDNRGGLHVAWEQFDSANVETTSNRLRADIFYTMDDYDNGASWLPAMRITEQGTWSCRFPSAIDHFEGDTFSVLYLMDQCAGVGRYGEGPVTENPVVVRRVVWTGLAEGKGPAILSTELSAAPNPFSQATTFSYQLGRAGTAALSIQDVTGRAVRRLAGGLQPAGSHSVLWDGRDDRGRALRVGVYFCTLDIGAKRISRKVVLTE